VHNKDHTTIPDAGFSSSILSSYFLPGDPQERLRSNKPLNRTASCELVSDFISSHSGMPRDPIQPHSVPGSAPLTSSISGILRNRLFKHSAAPQFKVQYLADRDVSKVTWFQEMMTHMPKS